MSVKSLILGRSLTNVESESEKIGVAAMGLDGLSSAAHGPEAALILLVPPDAAAPGFLAPLTFVICCCSASFTCPIGQ